MDGTLFNKFTGEQPNRRLRLVSYEYACSRFPRLVILLKQHKLRITVSGLREGYDIITIWRPGYLEDFWVLLREDFEIIKQIASESGLRIFKSETQNEIEDRILARIQVEFSNRKFFK